VTPGRRNSAYLPCVVDGCGRVAVSAAAGACRYHVANRRGGETSDGVNPGGGQRKLTPDDVKRVKRLSAGFRTNVSIAEEYGVSLSVIRKALRGEYDE
jgi:hypothetical protein